MYNNNNLYNFQQQIAPSTPNFLDKKVSNWQSIIPAPTQLTPERLEELVASIIAWDKQEAPTLPGELKRTGMWRYTDTQGNRILYKLRFDRVDAEGRPIKDESGKSIKTYRQISYGAFDNGIPNWHRKRLPYTPLYNQQELATHAEKMVVFVEGEKAADAGKKLFGDKYIFTTTGSATSAKDADFTPLKNRNILIIPDNDSAGKQHANILSKLVISAGANSVRVAKLPEDTLPIGWDIADEFPENFTTKELERLIDLNHTDISYLEPLKPTIKTSRIPQETMEEGILQVLMVENQDLNFKNSDLENNSAGFDGSKLELVKTGCRHNSIVSACGHLHHLGFHAQSIIEALCRENALRFDPPLSREEIEQKVYDVCSRYKSTRNIWQENQTGWSPILPLTGLVPEIEGMTLDYVPEPLRPYIVNMCERLQVSIETIFSLFLSGFGGLMGNRIGIAPKEKDDWIEVLNIWAMLVLPSGSMKSAILNLALKFIFEINDKKEKELKQKQEQYKIEAKLSKTNKSPPPEEPRDEKLITYSYSLAALVKLHTDNPHGIITVQDELSALFESFMQPGHETDRSFFLKAWSGTQSHGNLTLSRGTDYIPHACLSIIGCIQNDKFKEWFKDFLIDKSSGDGFLSRFQILLEPKIPETWEEKDISPDRSAEKKVRTIFELASKADFSDSVYKQYNLETIGDFLVTRFTSEAQKSFNTWLFKHMNFIRSEGKDEDSLIISYLSKTRKTLSSLALIFQLFEFFDPENHKKSLKVNEKNLALAMKHVEYYERHARRLFGERPSAILVLAHKIIQKIHAGKIYEGITTRDIKNDLSSGQKAYADRAFELLQQHNYIRIEEIGSRRPSQIIRINPEVFIQDKKVQPPPPEIPIQQDLRPKENVDSLVLSVSDRPIEKSEIAEQLSMGNSDDLEGMGFV